MVLQFLRYCGRWELCPFPAMMEKVLFGFEITESGCLCAVAHGTMFLMLACVRSTSFTPALFPFMTLVSAPLL